MEHKYLIQQDDCAPDSLEYFNEQMKKITGLYVHEFQKKGKETTTEKDNFISFSYENFILEIFPEDPFWKLRKKDECKKVNNKKGLCSNCLYSDCPAEAEDLSWGQKTVISKDKTKTISQFIVACKKRKENICSVCSNMDNCIVDQKNIELEEISRTKTHTIVIKKSCKDFKRKIKIDLNKSNRQIITIEEDIEL